MTDQPSAEALLQAIEEAVNSCADSPIARLGAVWIFERASEIDANRPEPNESQWEKRFRWLADAVLYYRARNERPLAWCVHDFGENVPILYGENAVIAIDKKIEAQPRIASARELTATRPPLRHRGTMRCVPQDRSIARGAEQNESRGHDQNRIRPRA